MSPSQSLLADAVERLNQTRSAVVPQAVEAVNTAVDHALVHLDGLLPAGMSTELHAMLRRSTNLARTTMTNAIGREMYMLNLRLNRPVRTERAPSRLPLEHELLNGEIGSVLLLHDTDRWYLGDFIRHAGWVTSLSAIGADLDVASNPSYLSLLQSDDRVSRLLDVSRMGEAELGRYDLVVVPGAMRPTTLSPAVVRGIYPHNTGWLYTRYGSPIHGGWQHEVNYFRSALHQYGQTALPTATPLSLRLPEDEVGEVGLAVRSVFGNDRPVVVYNPTASNPHTRRTTIPKEVENVISEAEHVTMLRALRDVLPDHNVLIGSALAPGDARNTASIRSLARTFAADPGVKTVFDLRRPELTSLRGFSMLLASDAVVASTGTSTGTNTHLASMVGLPSFSVERAADAEIQANWARQGVLPMGSVRWRNPSPLAGAVNVDWLTKTPADFEWAAAAFALHLGVQADHVGLAVKDVSTAHKRAVDLQQVLHGGPPEVVVSAAIAFRSRLQVEAQGLYGDFSDELALLRRENTTFAAVHELDDLLDVSQDLTELEAELIRNVIKDSMLHKVAQVLAPHPETELPAPVAPHDELLRKLRAQVPLTTAELDSLGAPDEFELATSIRERLAPYLDARATVAGAGGTTFQVGWQHEVTVNEGIVVKTLSTNDASEYLTDDYTLASIRDALNSAGGVVPPSALLDDHRTVSRRLKMLVEPDGKTVAPELGGGAVADTTLAPGWVDEQLDGYLRLAGQGIFNFDIKFKDIGFDDYGVLQVADFSVVTRLDRQPEQWPPPNRRTDVFHMGVTELIHNAQFLAEFANGAQLQEHFLAQVDQRIGIDLRPHLVDWEWGDHADPSITPLAARLREVILDRARTAQPRPVFPLVDNASEGITFDYISERSLENRT